MYASLRTSSYYSFLRGVSSPEEYAQRAAQLGYEAVCLTDWNGVYGAVQLQKACNKHGLRSIIGCSVTVGSHPLSVLAVDRVGYESMNSMLTALHHNEVPIIESWQTIIMLTNCVLLTSQPLPREAEAIIQAGKCCEVVVALDHQRKPGDTRKARKLIAYAQERSLRYCIAPDVRYATRDAYRTYDVLTCARLGITVFDPHTERPVNDEQHLRSVADLSALLPYPEAFATTAAIAQRCSIDILPGYVTPPKAQIPPNTTPNKVLKELCSAALHRKYPKTHAQAPYPSIAHTAAHTPLFEKASKQLAHELEVIASLELSDFFLVVHEIVNEASRRGIRHSGRGSAANSIVAYLLDITGVCPIEHNLLFERFLHRGRKGMPDIDVDFDSDRRQEIINWMEHRFGSMHTAMTATLVTYRARMAVRDAAKALGWPIETVNKLSKAIPGYTNKSLVHYRNELQTIVGDAPLLDVLLRVADALLGIPRHLGLHSGGMILSGKSLSHFTPVQRSANGTGVVQFDKDDVEAMGLVKFDVLGLRMLACISEAVELIARPDVATNLQCMRFDDPTVMNLIRSGKTLGLFQIESQGQMHMLAMHQPENFDDLVTEVALFRPGPLQGGMVHPYIRRRRGIEATTYLHPLLEPILRDTLGIVLFQEQVLEIAHKVAGMPLDEADDFRSLISKNRDAVAMERMHGTFVKGAMARGLDIATAEQVYTMVSHFVGYGFCRSHAAAFARIVYQSAWLKTYYPAAYMAAFMQHRPGFYNLLTLEEEARRLGVPVLLPHINYSASRYQLEQTPSGTLAIRKPLSAVNSVTEDVARGIVWERCAGYYRSVQDLRERITLPKDVLDNLALSGALDEVERDSRRALWQAGLLGLEGFDKNSGLLPLNTSDQRTLLQHSVTNFDIPEFPPIKAQERLAYDYVTHGSARIHPITLYRRMLSGFEIRTIDHLQHLVLADAPVQSTVIATVAGIVILRQAPPTAHGVLFVTLEDETGFVQCVVEPNEREYFKEQLRHAALIVRGVVHAKVGWRGLVVRDVRILRYVIGGYRGHPAMYGGTDTLQLEPNEPYPNTAVRQDP